MCQTILLIFLLAVALFFASLLAAAHYIGCWSVPIVLFLWLLVARLAAKYLFTRLALLPYTFRGRVLRKARVQIHAIEKLDRPAPARRHDIIDVDPTGNVRPAVGEVPGLPAGQDVIDPIREPAPESPPASDLPRTLIYRLDLTITPRHATPWLPADLAIIPASASLDLKSLPTLQPLAPTRVELFRTFDSAGAGGSFLDADPTQTCQGPQRVRLTFELPLANAEKSWRLLYHFLRLAEFRLPD